MNVFILRTVSDATSLAFELAEAINIKKSRARELLADSLGYGSYSALVAAIKAKPLLFHEGDILPSIASCYEQLTKRHDPIGEAVGNALKSYQLQRSTNVNGLYEIVFKASPNKLDDVKRANKEVHSLNDTLLGIGLVNECYKLEHYPHGKNEQNEIIEFHGRAHSEAFGKDAAPPLDELAEDEGYEFIMSICEEYISVYPGHIQLTTGLSTLYIRSGWVDSPNADIDDFDLSKLYCVTQVDHWGTKQIPVVLEPISKRFVSDLDATLNLSESFQWAVVSKDRVNDKTARVFDLPFSSKTANQVTEDMVRRLEPRRLDDGYGYNANIFNTITTYLTDDSELFTLTTLDDFQKEPVFSVYVRDGVLHFEYGSFLYLINHIDTFDEENFPKMQNALVELMQNLQGIAKNMGLGFDYSMSVKGISPYQLPKLVRGEHFYVLPIDAISIPYVPHEHYSADDESFYTAIEHIKGLERELSTPEAFAQYLKRRGVYSVSLAEYANELIFTSFYGVLTAYDRSNNCLFSFIYCSLAHLTYEREELLYTLRDAMEGGCWKVFGDLNYELVVSEYRPITFVDPVSFQPLGQRKSILMTKPALPYYLAHLTKPLIIYFHFIKPYKLSDYAGKHLGDDLLALCLPQYKALHEKEIGSTRVTVINDCDRCEHYIEPLTLLATSMNKAGISAPGSKADLERVSTASLEAFSEGILSGKYDAMPCYCAVYIFLDMSNRELIEYCKAHFPDSGSDEESRVHKDAPAEINRRLGGNYVVQAWFDHTFNKEEWTGEKYEFGL